MKQTSSQTNRKYSNEFKRSAVDRLLAGEGATAIAGDLKIRRKFLYAWRDEGYGSNGAGAKPKPVDTSQNPQQQQIAQQQQKITELERLVGQQAAQLDFFAVALRATTELRLKKSVNSGMGFIQQSKM